MRSFFYFYISLLCITALLTLNTLAFVARDTVSDIASTKGGILVKNGKQTSCELGVIDSTAAFVSASCLDYSGSSLKESTAYQVYLDAGINNTPKKYSVILITVHPEYNATTNLNPIAVLQFNTGSTEKWSNPIAIDRGGSWDDVLFIRRGLADMASMEWATPLTITNKYSNVAECDSDTRVFEANENDLFCSNATTYPPYTYLTGCAIPYGSVEVYISGKLYISGIYAYTTMGTSGYDCTFRFGQDSIYVLFADYIAFASKVLGRSIGYYPNSDGISPQPDPGYSMKLPKFPIKLVTLKNGDFYANQGDAPSDDNSSSAAESVDQTLSSSDVSMGSQSINELADPSSEFDSVYSFASASEAQSVATNDDDAGLRDNEDKLSKKTAIIGVVCGILGGLTLTSLSLYFYKRWRRARLNGQRDMKARTDNHSILVTNKNDMYIRPSIYISPTPFQKSTLLIPAALRSASYTQSRVNGFDKDTFEALEYYLPPLDEPNSPSTFSLSSSSSSAATISSWYRYL